MAKAKSTAKKVIKKKRSAGQSSSRPNQQAPLLPREPFQSWLRNPNAPPEVPGANTLTVFFHGLLSFCHDGNHHECQVGAYSMSDHHQFKIEIFGGDCSGGIFVRNDLLPDGHTITQSSAPGASFYMHEPFSRDSAASKDQDFRWMLDMEGSDVYGDLAPNKQLGFYSPRILFNTGEFYTCEKTASKFALVDTVTGRDHNPPIGNIAFCMAAYIDVSRADAILTLKRTGGLPDTICNFRRGGGPYQIFINNDCINTGTGTRPCLRNDFLHHFGSCSPPGSQHPLMLELTESYTASHHCGRTFVMRSNDDTPCTATGYGGTTGLQ